MGKFIDMTGWVMKEHGVPDSRLTVIKRTEDYITPSGKHYVQWLCECSCSDKNIIIVESKHLRYGHTKSCGCIKQEHMQTLGYDSRKYTQCDLTGNMVSDIHQMGTNFILTKKISNLLVNIRGI